MGGSAAGAAAKQYSLGTLGNAIAGAIGGGVVGQLIGAVAGSAVEGWVGDIAGGAVGGAILMVLAGLIRGATSNRLRSVVQLVPWNSLERPRGERIMAWPTSAVVLFCHR